MRTCTIVLLLVGAFAAPGFAQTEIDSVSAAPDELEMFEPVAPPPVEERTFEMFDLTKEPSFPGGRDSLMAFLGRNINYPPVAQENNIRGTVVITFVVDKSGSITDVSIIKDIGGGCGIEAARVVKLMPHWIPGEANGRPVRVRYTLPVRFWLE